MYLLLYNYQFTSKTLTEFISENNIKVSSNLQDNNIIQQLNEEKIKTKRLEEKIQKLKNINDNLFNELNTLRNNIQNLKNENNNLKALNINNKEINKIKQIITQKDEKIKELKLKLKKSVDINDIMVINFLSTDQFIRCGIPCLPDDTFAEVEEKLYRIYNEFRDTNNLLLFNGRIILRFKKIKENSIQDGDIIQIVKTEDNNN